MKSFSNLQTRGSSKQGGAGSGEGGIIQPAVSSSFWPDKNKKPVAYFYTLQDFPSSCAVCAVVGGCKWSHRGETNANICLSHICKHSTYGSWAAVRGYAAALNFQPYQILERRTRPVFVLVCSDVSVWCPWQYGARKLHHHLFCFFSDPFFLACGLDLVQKPQDPLHCGQNKGFVSKCKPDQQQSLLWNHSWINSETV